MNAAQREALEQELLELYFDCHPEPDALRARIANEPELATLYDTVRERAELLERAARVDDAEFEPKLPRPFFKRHWFPVQIAAAACVLVSAYWGICEWNLHQQRKDTVHFTAKTRTSVPDGRTFAIEMSAKDHYGRPADCEVQYAILDADGTPIRKGTTTTGRGPIESPASIPGARSVVLTAETPRGARTVTIPMRPHEVAPLIHIETDKPLYRPGETMRFRAVMLDRLKLAPLTDPSRMQFRILDPKDSEQHTQWARNGFTPDQHGVAWGVWSIPEDLTGGTYRVEVKHANDERLAVSHEVVIRRYQAPRFDTEITLDRASYAPGAGGVAEIRVQRLGGDVARGAGVRASIMLDGDEVWRESTTLDHNGRARVAFSLPEEVDRGEARLFARIDDGGTIETSVEPFVVPNGRIVVRSYAEGGELIAGVETRTYLELTDSLDRPLSAAGRIVDSQGREVAKFRTVHAGRATVTFTPEAGERYACELSEPQKLAVDLPEVVSHGIGLRSLDLVTDAGQPVRMRVVNTTRGAVTVGAFCRGSCVATERVVGAGTHDVTLDVPDEVFGVLRITAFDEALMPRAERLVQREPGRHVAISFDLDRSTLEPGGRQKIRIRTTDETGRPIAAAVGVAVTDRAVDAMTPEPRIGIVDRIGLIADVDVAEDLADYLVEAQGQPERVDLLLGTRGWRKFVWTASADELQAVDGFEIERIRTREGFAPKVTAVHAPDAAANAVWETRREARDARRWTVASFAISILILAAYFGAVGCAKLARRLRWSASWRGDLAAGLTGIVAVGVLVFVVLPDPLGRAAPSVMQALGMATGDESKGAWEMDAPGAVEEFDGFVVDHLLMDGGADDLGFWAGEQPDAEQPEVNPEPQADPVARVDPLVMARPNEASAYDEPIRVYAHRHRNVGERTDFTENVYWNALLVTDADGRAEFEFDVSDRVTTWDTFANAHTTGRTGQSSASFDSTLPFHIDIALPVELTEGDALELPVAVACDREFATEAELRYVTRGDVATDEDARLFVALQDGRGSARIPLRGDVTTGARTGIGVVGAAGRFRDRVAHELRVVPRGFPHRRSWAGTATRTGQSFTVTMPAELRPGSAKVTLKVFPSPLASLREGLEGILQEPHGCFEQASSSNYPNTMVLAYLEASGDDIPVVAARAHELMPSGYAKITSYECSRRGYEWFGANPGHEALTAYGLMQFQDMAQVFDVDSEMVARTREWLLRRRDGDGSFARNRAALDSFGSAPVSVTDAYIVYALLYAGEDPATLQAEIRRLEQRSETTTDAYELAIIACALGRADSYFAVAARDRLGSMQRADGSLCGSTSSITRSGERDLTIETTAFAVLAWLDDRETYSARVQKACLFIQSQQSARGTFGATQATIMALKALTANAQATRALPDHGHVDVYVGDDHVASHEFSSDDADAIEVELARHVRLGSQEIRVEVHADDPEASLPFACDLAYHSDMPADDEDAVLEIRTRIATTDIEVGDPVAIEVRLTNRTNLGQPMALARVGLPANVTVPTPVLDALKQADAFDLWEIDGRTLTFYWRALAPNAEKTFVIDGIANIGGKATGPASSAYLYYTPDSKRWAPGLELDVE